jgi:hypothetical protein
VPRRTIFPLADERGARDGLTVVERGSPGVLVRASLSHEAPAEREQRSARTDSHQAVGRCAKTYDNVSVAAGGQEQDRSARALYFSRDSCICRYEATRTLCTVRTSTSTGSCPQVRQRCRRRGWVPCWACSWEPWSSQWQQPRPERKRKTAEVERERRSAWARRGCGGTRVRRRDRQAQQRNTHLNLGRVCGRGHIKSRVATRRVWQPTQDHRS